MPSQPRILLPCQHTAHVNCVYILERCFFLTQYVSPYCDTMLATESHARGSIGPCCWCHHSRHWFCKLQMCNSKLSAFSLLFQVSHLVFRYCEPKSKQFRLALLLVVPVLLSNLISYTGRSLCSAVPLAFVVYTGALILFTLAYRLSPSHPLAKYPGPVIAKTSKWWAAYISARGDSHRYQKYLHDIYGDVVRIGQGRRLLSWSVPLSIVRAQRALDSRCFPYSPHSRPKWPAERTTCVHVISITSIAVDHRPQVGNVALGSHHCSLSAIP